MYKRPINNLHFPCGQVVFFMAVLVLIEIMSYERLSNNVQLKCNAMGYLEKFIKEQIQSLL